MRSLANVTINFGLVNAPVKVFKATEEKDVKFKLCSPDGSPVTQKYYGTDGWSGTKGECEKMTEDGFKIDPEVLKDIEQAAVVENGQDLKKTMTVVKTIPLDKLPAYRVTGCYYLAANAQASSMDAFATICAAMENKGVGAVVKWVPRQRQETVILFVQDGIMYGLSVIFAADMREADATIMAHQKVEVQPALLEMAESLLDTYLDEDAAVLDELEDTLLPKRTALVEQARKGEKVDVTEVTAPAPATDLMEALKASMKKNAEKEAVGS